MIIEDDSSIGKRVRRYREARGWSQIELSEKTGLSQSGISKIETDELTPSVDKLQKIADVLGVALSDLITQQVKSGADQDRNRHYVRQQEDHSLQALQPNDPTRVFSLR